MVSPGGEYACGLSLFFTKWRSTAFPEHSTLEEALEKAATDYWLLRNITEEIRADHEIVLAAMATNGGQL